MFLDKRSAGNPLSLIKTLAAGCLSACLLAGTVLTPAMAAAQTPPPAQASTHALASSPAVNINTAGAEEIADLMHGVGLAKANAIVDYRTEHGPFAKIEDLLNVKGIGESTLAKNQQNIKLH